MITVFLKVAVIFCMVAIGLIAHKAKLLPTESNKYLVNLLLSITAPCMILGSLATQSLTSETFRQTVEVLVGSTVFFIAAALVSFVIVKAMKYSPESDQGIIMTVITAVNTGFMGFPVTKAIFGDEYLFLMVVENIILTLYLYSLAVIQINYGHKQRNSVKDILRPLCNMCMLAAAIGMVILFTGLRLPVIVTDFFNTIGDATIPISMIVVGIQLGDSNLRAVFKNFKLIVASLCNVLLIPVLTFLAVNWLPLTSQGKLILVFAAAFPCAVVTTAVASRERKNAGLMAEGVAITTLMSMITLPVFAVFLMAMYC